MFARYRAELSYLLFTLADGVLSCFSGDELHFFERFFSFERKDVTNLQCKEWAHSVIGKGETTSCMHLKKMIVVSSSKIIVSLQSEALHDMFAISFSGGSRMLIDESSEKLGVYCIRLNLVDRLLSHGDRVEGDDKWLSIEQIRDCENQPVVALDRSWTLFLADLRQTCHLVCMVLLVNRLCSWHVDFPSSDTINHHCFSPRWFFRYLKTFDREKFTYSKIDWPSILPDDFSYNDIHFVPFDASTRKYNFFACSATVFVFVTAALICREEWVGIQSGTYRKRLPTYRTVAVWIRHSLISLGYHSEHSWH